MCYERLKPQAFYVSAFEVTNAEFREFARDAQGYDDNANWTEAGRKWRGENPSQASALLKESDAESQSTVPAESLRSLSSIGQRRRMDTDNQPPIQPRAALRRRRRAKP
jgi:hypothetical protein